jgi:hypothetical protein
MKNLRSNDLIIPHLVERKLLLRQEAGWRLPAVLSQPIHKWWRETLPVTRAMQAQLGIHGAIRECLAVYSKLEGCRSAIFLVDLQNVPVRLPAGMAWVSLDEALQLGIPEQAAALREWLQRSEADCSEVEKRFPWSRVGWFGDAVQWMREQVNARGLELIGAVEQVRHHGPVSAILRAPTSDGGHVYLKAVSELYSQEPLLTATVASEHPAWLPQVYAVHEQERWLLLKAFDGHKLNQLADRGCYLEHWKSLLGWFARLQVSYIHRLDKLRAMGCPDWGLSRLIESAETVLPKVLSDTADAGQSCEKQHLSLSSRLVEAGKKLQQYGLPDTLHHGDFHSGNILTNGDSCCVLDWAFQAGGAHPFLFMSVVYEEHGDVSNRNALRREYLSAWEAYAPLAALEEAMSVAQPLAAYHAALGHYRQFQFSALPVQREQERGAVRHYLDIAATALP